MNLNILLPCMNFMCLLFHFGETKTFRVIVDDQVLPYEIDKQVMPITEQFSLDELIFEQVDDDYVIIGGHIKCIKSMDPRLPIQMLLTTQFYESATWKEGPIRLVVGDTCKEMTNPSRFWYNYTKLFSLCPAKQGDIWPIEQQSVNVQIELPPSMKSGAWKAFTLLTQGMAGMETTKFGFGLKYEFSSDN